MEQIHSRGYLPHVEGADYQFITYRMADSLPPSVINEIYGGLSSERERRMKVEECLDKGLGSCVLAKPEIAKLIVENWLHFHGNKYDLISYVVMPNHVHVLIRVYEKQTLSKIIHSWKSYTAKQAQNFIDISMIPFWQQEYWDRYIRDEKHFNQVIEYIEQNPVKAGLVKTAEDYKWSSAGSVVGLNNAGSADGPSAYLLRN